MSCVPWVPWVVHNVYPGYIHLLYADNIMCIALGTDIVLWSPLEKQVQVCSLGMYPCLLGVSNNHCEQTMFCGAHWDGCKKCTKMYLHVRDDVLYVLYVLGLHPSDILCVLTCAFARLDQTLDSSSHWKMARTSPI